MLFNFFWRLSKTLLDMMMTQERMVDFFLKLELYITGITVAEDTKLFQLHISNLAWKGEFWNHIIGFSYSIENDYKAP